MKKKLSWRYEPDSSLDHVEIVIRAPEQDEFVTELIERVLSPYMDTLPAFNDKGICKNVVMDEIMLASVEGKLVRLVTADGDWYVRQPLQSLEDTLDKRRFVRISRYEIINLEKVSRYDFTIAGTVRIVLTGGIETWASRRCIPRIRRILTGKE